MGDTLDELHRLQTVELKLAVARRTRQAKQHRVDVCRRRVTQTEQQLKEDQRTGRERQVRLDALALEVAAREESINKHRQALAKARTNKEYAAILTAMNTEKADNTKIENTMLEVMEEIQSFKDRTAKIEAEKAGQLEDVGAAEAALQTFDDETKQKNEELLSVRDECAAGIAPTTLATFHRAAQRHDAEAMASIQRVHPKRDGYVCSGCNMTVSLEVVNILQTHGEIQLCGACQRILFLETAGPL